MRLFSLLLIALTTLLHAESLPPGGKDCLTPEAHAGHASIPVANGTATHHQATDGPVPDYWHCDITTAPANSWNTALTAPVSGTITKGDRCLLAFYCRGVSGKVSGAANVEDRAASYHKVGHTEFTARTAWTQIFLPFEADESITDHQGQISLHLGKEAQCLDIGGLQLLNYGPTYDLATLPHVRLSYEGREADAPWRMAALARIDKLRQGPLSLAVTDAAGEPQSNVAVHAVLQRHAFGFGTAVTAAWLCDATPDGEKYRAVVDANFSRVVLENDLKKFAFENYVKPVAEQTGSFRQAYLDQALGWLGAHHFSIRGHYLCWAPYEPWSEQLKDTPAAIQDAVFAHVDQALTTAGQRVSEWDALNHPVAWEQGICIDSVLGKDFYASVFRRARALTKLPLWINEDQVFRPGRQQEEYFQVIQKLLADGVKLDGIGNQAHFHASFLPSPEEILANSDRFAKLVPALQITEFDINTDGDDALAADYTRDLLITCFSHPAYTGFVMWGFWEGSHWKPSTALWRKDWSVKPNGQAWLDWVCGKWRTDAHLTTDPQGHATTPAFYGHYLLTLTNGTRTSTQEMDFTPTTAGTIKLRW